MQSSSLDEPSARGANNTFVALAVLVPLLLVGALVSGRSELAALAAPFAVVLVVAVAGSARSPRVEIDFLTDDERRMEGDRIDAEVVVTATATVHRIDVAIEHPSELQAVDNQKIALWSMRPRAGRAERRTVHFLAHRWGAYPLGPVWVRVYGPFGLVRWTAAVIPARVVRVVPAEATLRRAVTPSRTGLALGVHESRARGDGFDYAASRPFAAGDRVRAINWRATARHGELWANDRHPDRNADVVLFLDTFADSRSGGAIALKRAVVAAWSIALAQLKGRDRVGVVTFGGYPAWITPGLGERAKALILDRLLVADATWTEIERPLHVVPPRALPSSSLVVVLTPLHDERIVSLVGGLTRRGLEVAVFVVDATALVNTPPGHLGERARRLWVLEQRRRVDMLQDLGCAVVTWHHDTVLADAIETLDAALALHRRQLR